MTKWVGLGCAGLTAAGRGAGPLVHISTDERLDYLLTRVPRPQGVSGPCPPWTHQQPFHHACRNLLRVVLRQSPPEHSSA